MTTCTESVPSLVKELCENCLKRDPQRAFLTQPTETREHINRTLQRKVYDTVFGYLRSQQRYLLCLYSSQLCFTFSVYTLALSQASNSIMSLNGDDISLHH